MTEYKVITMKRSSSPEKLGIELQEILNTHAKDGWKFKQMEGFFVFLEKD
jgi:hypothetical protein